MENVKQGDEEKKGNDKGKKEERRRKNRKKRREKEGKHITTQKQMGIYKSLKSAGVPPDLARQFVSRHLCTALAVPLLWHTEIFFFFYRKQTKGSCFCLYVLRKVNKKMKA